MDINHLLLDLEVIKQIMENDKLAVITLPGSTKLSVDCATYTSSIKRWYYSYNREDSINYLEQLTNNIEKTCDFIISGQHNDEAEIIKNAILNSFIGLENLKKTYIKDSVISAKITLIINKLKTLSKNLENFINNTINIINELEHTHNKNLLINNNEEQ